MILGIDASSPGSGGGKRHLIELLKCFQFEKFGFSHVRIWGVEETLSQIPDSPNIEKLSHAYLNRGIFHRFVWQIFLRDKTFKDQFDILFSPFGTYTGKIRPYVSMSQNMLIFQSSERKRFGLSLLRLKLKLLYYKQKKVFHNSQGIIFLSQFAKNQIGKLINLKGIETEIIHHGVSNSFRSEPKEQYAITNYNFENPFKFLYVSTIWAYKHPWNVVEAITELRKKGFPIVIDIVGNIEEVSAAEKLGEAINKNDKYNEFVFWHKEVSLVQVAEYYKKSDAFVFASTCENMPIILIEAMSSGLPIACSNYQPMPEFLKETGIYFDPLSINSIVNALEKLLTNLDFRKCLARESYNLSEEFKWEKCAEETFSFLYKIGKKFINKEYV